MPQRVHSNAITSKLSFSFQINTELDLRVISPPSGSRCSTPPPLPKNTPEKHFFIENIAPPPLENAPAWKIRPSQNTPAGSSIEND